MKYRSILVIVKYYIVLRNIPIFKRPSTQAWIKYLGMALCTHSGHILLTDNLRHQSQLKSYTRCFINPISVRYSFNIFFGTHALRFRETLNLRSNIFMQSASPNVPRRCRKNSYVLLHVKRMRQNKYTWSHPFCPLNDPSFFSVAFIKCAPINM